MDPALIRAKFGDSYSADERAFIMGIDQRFTRHFAERFRGLAVLETCTGAGFTTIALARNAERVITVDVDGEIQKRAVQNVGKAGLAHKVRFVSGDVLDQSVMASLPPMDAAFLDPDWAVTGPDHVHRFRNSTTRPPADKLLAAILGMTGNIALVLPPQIADYELEGLPGHERERLYLDGSHELLCLYFGGLARSFSATEFRA